jgi:hypothetical protein
MSQYISWKRTREGFFTYSGNLSCLIVSCLFNLPNILFNSGISYSDVMAVRLHTMYISVIHIYYERVLLYDNSLCAILSVAGL